MFVRYMHAMYLSSVWLCFIGIVCDFYEIYLICSPGLPTSGTGEGYVTPPVSGPANS